METLLTKIVDGAGIGVLVILLIAYAFYQWPFLLLWRANEALMVKHDATQEKTLIAFNEASAANRELATAVLALKVAQEKTLAALSDAKVADRELAAAVNGLKSAQEELRRAAQKTVIGEGD